MLPPEALSEGMNSKLSSRAGQNFFNIIAIKEFSLSFCRQTMSQADSLILLLMASHLALALIP
jgi:hypothetical protein